MAIDKSSSGIAPNTRISCLIPKSLKSTASFNVATANKAILLLSFNAEATSL